MRAPLTAMSSNLRNEWELRDFDGGDGVQPPLATGLGRGEVEHALELLAAVGGAPHAGVGEAEVDRVGVIGVAGREARGGNHQLGQTAFEPPPGAALVVA